MSMAAPRKKKPASVSRDKPLSLSGMTPEEALRKALYAPPQKADRQQHGVGTILFDTYGVRLRIGENDSLIMDVMCGGVGSYMVAFPLNADEYERYKREGDSFLKEMEVKVRSNPRPFIKRG